MKTIILFLVIASASAAAQESSAKEDTITAGNWNDYHPSFSRYGEYNNNSSEWLVFDRQTEDSSFIVVKKLDKATAKWDSSEIIVSRSGSEELLTLPDISLQKDYGIIVWQKRTAGKWNLYYSTRSLYTQAWSLPAALTNDTLDNINVRLQPIGSDSQFVAAWQNKHVLRMNKYPFTQGNASDTIAVSNDDSVEFDLGIGTMYSYNGAILYGVKKGESKIVVSQSFSFYASFSLATPETVQYNTSIERPRFVQNYDFSQRIIYQSPSLPGNDASDLYVYTIHSYFINEHPLRISASSDTGWDINSYSYSNARAYFFPLIASVQKNPIAVQGIPYNYLIVCERFIIDEAPDKPTVAILQPRSTDVIASAGYNRNPVVGSRLYYASSQHRASVPVVWESNRTGKSHLYGKTTGSFGIDGVQETHDMPVRFSLMQNYPNPFNPSTTIAFSVPSRSFVTLKIYDVLGKEVATLLNEELPAGTFSRVWNAGPMSSGVYFYRIQAGTFSNMKRLILLR